MALYYPIQPHDDSKLTSRLTVNNWQGASAIRLHQEAGYIQVYIVGYRYFDRGAGGFMGGGGNVFEGQVVCESYPAESSSHSKMPATISAADRALADQMHNQSGQLVDFSGPKNRRAYLATLGKKFWTVKEALAYANGEDGGALGMETQAVRVTWTKTGYKLQLIDA